MLAKLKLEQVISVVRDPYSDEVNKTSSRRKKIAPAEPPIEEGNRCKEDE